MATATFPKLQEYPSKHLQCALCVESYQDARILPCFHTFCASCLQSACLQEDGRNTPVVYCPICMDESELPSNGIQGLPKNMYIQNLQTLQRSPSPLPKCDLCTDNEVAVCHCEVCCCHLCEFCEQAHQRQRKTAEHPLVPVQGSSSLMHHHNSEITVHPEFCESHPSEHLRLFCDSCNVPVCQECTMDEHHDHALLPLEDVNMQYSEILQSLLGQTTPLISTLIDSMKNIEYVLSTIQDRADAVAHDICDSIDARMRALQEHKRSLLNQLDAIKQHKENTLEQQLEEMKRILDQVNVHSSLAVKAVEQGNPATAFSSDKVPLVARLEELLTSDHNFHPEEDDYIQFCPNLPAGQSRGFEMFGVLDARGPSAAHSIVEGEGLFEARQRKMTSFLVTIHDRYGERRLSGGDKVEAYLHSQSGTMVNTTVTDNGDGTYQVSYTPESTGDHRLSVLIDGKHVRASPFVVNIRPRRKKHRGIFHCCTFCSSEGKKHVRCGCGGIMPGGYSGCGHGHPGHPGCFHWSCCGSTIEKSECLL